MKKFHVTLFNNKKQYVEKPFLLQGFLLKLTQQTSNVYTCNIEKEKTNVYSRI